MESDEVTAREVMNDAARVGGIVRELRQLQYEEAIIADRFYLEITGEEDKTVKGTLVRERVRAEKPELISRIRYLSDEYEAIFARGRLIEMAALAEQLVS